MPADGLAGPSSGSDTRWIVGKPASPNSQFQALQGLAALAPPRAVVSFWTSLLTSTTSAFFHSMELSEGLLELLSEGCLCDVNLVAGDGAVVKAHKVVLAARSNYLRARLTGPWSESQDSSTVRLPDIAGSTLEICVKVSYR